MKTNTLYILLILLCSLSACNSKHTYKIKGTIANEAYNGETVYLISKYNKKRIIKDSTTIQNQKFTFSGNIKETGIFYLNVRPVMPHLMEELMLIIEPASTTKASIDTKSTTNGTILNDKLEEWKSIKTNFDKSRNKLFSEIYKIRKSDNPDPNEIQSLKAKMENIEKQFITETSAIILANNQNILGQFLMKIYFSKIEHQKKVEILKTASESFLNDETIQKLVKDINYKY